MLSQVTSHPLVCMVNRGRYLIDTASGSLKSILYLEVMLLQVYELPTFDSGNVRWFLNPLDIHDPMKHGTAVSYVV